MRLLILFILLSAFSCKSAEKIAEENFQAIISELPGAYIGKTKGGQGMTNFYTLTINSDNTFTYEVRAFEGNSKCSGEWELGKDNTLICKCYTEEDITIILSNGYMSKRENVFRIFDGMIRSENVIFWKQKD